MNIWGRDPKTGFARRPMDNIGIQYGLTALAFLFPGPLWMVYE